jgi:hypothetical protein
MAFQASLFRKKMGESMDSSDTLWHIAFMTNNTFKNSLLVILSTTLLVACASNPANDQFTADEIAPKTEVKATEALLPSAEISAIEAELASIEAQIQAAQARLTHYQVQNETNPVTQSQIMGAEAEINHYQMQKNHLMARKNMIQSTVK